MQWGERGEIEKCRYIIDESLFLSRGISNHPESAKRATDIRPLVPFDCADGTSRIWVTDPCINGRYEFFQGIFIGIEAWRGIAVARRTEEIEYEPRERCAPTTASGCPREQRGELFYLAVRSRGNLRIAEDGGRLPPFQDGVAHRSSMKIARFTRPPWLRGIMDSVWNPPLAIFALEACSRLGENNQAYLNAPARRIESDRAFIDFHFFRELTLLQIEKLPKVKYLGHTRAILYFPRREEGI